MNRGDGMERGIDVRGRSGDDVAFLGDSGEVNLERHWYLGSRRGVGAKAYLSVVGEADA